MDQTQAPILEALERLRSRPPSGFGAPGHGTGRGASADILRLLGKKVFQADVLTPKGLDDRTESQKVVQRAHALAAEAWGADLCRFVTGGSTQSLHTLLCAVARPGEEVLIAGNCHKAEFSAAVFAGLTPVVIPPAVDAAWDLEHGLEPDAVASALEAHPKARAVVVVSPTYFGVTSDICALAAVCRAAGTPLIVDAAWGAAFGFNPRLPQNPLAQGADAMVTSLHKTLGVLSQGSALFVRGAGVDAQRLALAYELFETTSPSVPILASLDAARRSQALNGGALWDRVLDLAEHARAQLQRVPGVKVFDTADLAGFAAADLDRTKILLDVKALGVSGFEADDWLTQHHGVSLGLSDDRRLLAVFSLGTSQKDVSKLLSGVRALSKAARRRPSLFKKPVPERPGYGELKVEMAMSAPDAFGAETEMVALERCQGRIAAEIIAPAPPGVPRLIPGQRILGEHVSFLTALRDAGVFILDPADPDEKRLRVVKAMEGEPAPS